MIYLLFLLLTVSGYPDWITNPPEDGVYFYGFSFVNIEEGDEEKALSIAKERAIIDLASKIEVRVEGTIKTVLKVEGKGMSETQSYIFEEQVETSINIFLTRVKEYRRFIDRDHKRVAVMVRVNYAEYERNLRKEMEMNKGVVLGFINEGDKSKKEGECTITLLNYLLAYTRLKQLFQNLPLYEDIDKDGYDEELSSTIRARIENCLNNIDLFPVKDNLVYSIFGALGENIKIKVRMNEDNEHFLCKNFPLKDTVILGQAEISRTSNTVQSGIAEFRVGKIDPSFDKVIVRIIPDLNRLIGEYGKFPKFILPYTEVTLLRKKTVALSVYFNNAGTTTNLGSLNLEIKNYLLNKEYGVEDKRFRNELTIAQMDYLSKEGIDIALLVNIETRTKEIEEDLYVSYADAVISLYSIKERSIITTEVISSDKTFGGTTTQCGLKAYAKIKGNIIKSVKNLEYE